MMEESEVTEIERMESIVSSMKTQLNNMNSISSPESISVGKSCERIIHHIQKNSQGDSFVAVPGAIESEKNRFHTSMDGGGGCCIIA